MCRGRELNPHARKQGILSPSCLPIPPPRHSDVCVGNTESIIHIFNFLKIFYDWFMNTRTRIAGIVIQDSKILMLKGIGYEELWTPGGKINNNESDIECLKREFQEEIEVDIVKAELY